MNNAGFGVEEFPLVSVAVITYNQKDFLRECIESILKQDYPNIEIVVADDCSSDGTQDMLHWYNKKYPGKFILKLSPKNLGVTLNSNQAHFACSGRYIAWMGGDDLMLPGKLTKQVGFMEANSDCSICYHNLDVFDSATNKTLYYFNERSSQKLNGDIRTSIRFGAFNGACSNLVRADKTPKFGFNNSLPVASDWLYWVDTLGNGGTIQYIDEILGRYRRHDKNVTKQTEIISQNELDHLVTCQIILSKYPQYFKDVMYVYSLRLLSIRKKVNYIDVVFKSLLINFSYKPVGGILIYLMSFGKIKL